MKPIFTIVSLAASIAASCVAAFAATALHAQTDQPADASEFRTLGEAVQAIKEDRYRLPLEILDYDITPEDRGNVADCRSNVRQELQEVYQTCWPVLQSYQETIRLHIAKRRALAAFEEQSPDRDALLDEAMGMADAMIVDIPSHEWPMQTDFSHGAYRVKFDLLKAFGRTDAALNVMEAYLDAQKTSPMYRAQVTRGYLYKDRTEYLLLIGRRDDARRLFQEALEENPSFDKISFDEHAEILMHDAIWAGDDEYALSLFADYIPRVRRDDDWFSGVSVNLRYYKIYVLAGRGDVDGVLAEFAAMDGIWHANISCEAPGNAEYYFPFVVSPLENNPRVSAVLKDIGCTDAMIADIAGRMENGVDASAGIRPLPPRGE